MKNLVPSAAIAATMIFAASLVLFAAPARAQTGTEAMQDAGLRFQAEQAQAQADAAHPGDDALTCDQIQSEMGAIMNTPDMLAQRSGIQASVQRQQELQEEARQRASGQMATGIVTGIVSSFVPGAGYAQAAAIQAQASQQQAAASESQSEMAGMIGNMSNMMPAMMRGQRLSELAHTQQCAFLQDPQPSAR